MTKYLVLVGAVLAAAGAYVGIRTLTSGFEAVKSDLSAVKNTFVTKPEITPAA